MAIWNMFLTKYIWLQLVCVVVAGIGVFSYLHNETTATKPPQAVHGVLDLSEWDFAGGGTVKPDGQWEFYWRQLLEPSDFQTGTEAYPVKFVAVPDKWKNYQIEGNQNGDGFATYRLHIKLREAGQCLAIKVPDIATAYKIYVNGQLVCSAGTTGRLLTESKPQYLPQVASFHAERQDLEVVIQVANFVHHKGGIKSSLYLGLEDAVYKLREKQMGFELFLLGVFLIMTVYHFGLYLLRTSDKPALYFGLFCLLIALRTMTTGEMVVMEFFPAFEWELLLKIEYLSYYLSVPVFVKFIDHLYNENAPSKITDAVQWISMLFSGLVIMTPVKFFAKTLIGYDVFTLSVIVLVGRILVKAVSDKKEGASCFALGVFLLLATVVNDMLFANGVIFTGEMVPIGLFVFIFFPGASFVYAVCTSLSQSGKLIGRTNSQQ